MAPSHAKRAKLARVCHSSSSESQDRKPAAKVSIPKKKRVPTPKGNEMGSGRGGRGGRKKGSKTRKGVEELSGEEVQEEEDKE